MAGPGAESRTSRPRFEGKASRSTRFRKLAFRKKAFCFLLVGASGHALKQRVSLQGQEFELGSGRKEPASLWTSLNDGTVHQDARRLASWGKSESQATVLTPFPRNALSRATWTFLHGTGGRRRPVVVRTCAAAAPSWPCHMQPHMCAVGATKGARGPLPTANDVSKPPCPPACRSVRLQRPRGDNVRGPSLGTVYGGFWGRPLDRGVSGGRKPPQAQRSLQPEVVILLRQRRPCPPPAEHASPWGSGSSRGAFVGAGLGGRAPQTKAPVVPSRWPREGPCGCAAPALPRPLQHCRLTHRHRTEKGVTQEEINKFKRSFREDIMNSVQHIFLDQRCL